MASARADSRRSSRGRRSPRCRTPASGSTATSTTSSTSLRSPTSSRAYADFQSLPVTPVGDLLAWLEHPPTKLVVVGDPAELDALRPRLVEQFGERLFIAKSLPYFLELASPRISKGTGLAFVAEHLGLPIADTVAFGDGENDFELLDRAGYGIAVENGHEELKARADWICPGVKEEGVAQVLEAYLDSRA